MGVIEVASALAVAGWIGVWIVLRNCIPKSECKSYRDEHEDTDNSKG